MEHSLLDYYKAIERTSSQMLDAAKFEFCCEGLGLMPLDVLKDFNRRYAAGEIDLQGKLLLAFDVLEPSRVTSTGGC